METAPRVYSVEVGRNFNNVYLIKGRRAAFFDSGFDTVESVDAVLKMWESAGRPEVEAIIVSHRHADHSGGARKLSGATGGVIICSPTEKGPIESEVPGTSVGQTVADHEALDLGGATLQLVHTPGHTVGSLGAIYREEGLLFAGDTIRSSEPFKIDAGAGDMGMHLDTLRKLRGYDLKRIAPGHGPMVEDPADHIDGDLARLGAAG